LFILFTAACATTDSDLYDPNPSTEPEEYTSDEFAPWLNDVRRAEVIFFGSIPITILFSNIGYGIYDTLASGAGGSYSIENFTQTTSMTNDDRFLILGISAGLSAVIAISDYIIGLFEKPEDYE